MPGTKDAQHHPQHFMILDKPPVSSLPHSLRSSPAQAAKLILRLRRLQHTTAATKACNGKLTGRQVRCFF